MTIPLFSFVPLPAAIFVAEMCVVTLATIRIIFLSRGYKGLASLLGFFEISIWLFAIGQIMKNLDNWSCHMAFAGGFVLGNYLGVIVERKLAIGTLVVRTITRRDPTGLIEQLRQAHYGVTTLDAQGATGRVKMVYTVIPRKDADRVLGIIRGFDPVAFYSVDEVQSAAAGIFPAPRSRGLLPGLVRTPARAA